MQNGTDYIARCALIGAIARVGCKWKMTSVQTSCRDERFMEDIKGALKSKNYSVGVSNAHTYFTIATGFDLCCLNVHVFIVSYFLI